MGFVQLIRMRTDRFDELEAAHERWLGATEGQRTVQRELICRNRDVPDEVWVLVEFPDWEAAMRNNDLPATAEIAGELGALASDGPTFVNLDVVRAD
jgi:hypothetical protein